MNAQFNPQKLRNPGEITEALLPRYRNVRAQSAAICRPLSAEDHVIQGIPDASPPKWHLAHTSWFFETFLLLPHLPGYKVFNPGFDHLFNSYYETVSQPFFRPHRGLLARPTVAEIMDYRAYVDKHMHTLLGQSGQAMAAELAFLTETGLHHEQQHQELLYTDIKYNFAINPLDPVYTPPSLRSTDSKSVAQRWVGFPSGMIDIGNDNKNFCFDNETPVHPVYLAPFALASRLVTNEEYLQFIADGGYGTVSLWLADAWKTVQTEQWQAPLYWRRINGAWYHATLHGLQAVEMAAPVCHVSYYEADAYARWAGVRLPTEQEWESVARDFPVSGNLVESGRMQPAPATGDQDIEQLFGDVWEWTQSAYLPYPGFKALEGSLGEYNGKFMANQMVLRGGSCFTAADHIRASYRNFFYPKDRWQMTGIRLARSI